MSNKKSIVLNHDGNLKPGAMELGARKPGAIELGSQEAGSHGAGES